MIPPALREETVERLRLMVAKTTRENPHADVQGLVPLLQERLDAQRIVGFRHRVKLKRANAVLIHTTVDIPIACDTCDGDGSCDGEPCEVCGAEGTVFKGFPIIRTFNFDRPKPAKHNPGSIFNLEFDFSW